MAKEEYQEHDIEHLLQKMPRLKDNLLKEEIFQAVERKMNKKKRYRPLLVPIFASIAAIFFLILFVPSIVQREDTDLSASKDAKVEPFSAATERMDSALSNAQDKAIKESVMLTDAKVNKTAVYKDNLTQYDVINYGFITEDAITVPISVMMPKEARENSWEAQFKEVAEKLPLEEWGFSETPPQFYQEVNMEKNNEEIFLYLKENVDYFIYGEHNFWNALQYSFRYQDVKAVNISDEEGNILNFGNMGEMDKIVIDHTPHTNYYAYTLKNGATYVAPSELSYSSLAEALEAMKNTPNDFYEPLVPKEVALSVIEEENHPPIIRFRSHYDLMTGDKTQQMRMMEGILLTAKDFGYEEVKFQNLSPEEWGGFNFSEKVEVPYSPNRMLFETK